MLRARISRTGKKTLEAKIKEKRQKRITARYEATAPVVLWF